jgi:hypothetical protein
MRAPCSNVQALNDLSRVAHSVSGFTGTFQPLIIGPGWFAVRLAYGSPGKPYDGWQLPPTVNVPALSSQAICHVEKSSQPFIHPNQPNV